jgi:hypothetical protein
MSHALATHYRQDELDVVPLAEDLGISPDLLIRLALCRRPEATSEEFANQVREIADYTLTDEAQLAGLLRQVDALEKFAGLEGSAPDLAFEPRPLPVTGVLAAARDRGEEDDGDSASARSERDETQE